MTKSRFAYAIGGAILAAAFIGAPMAYSATQSVPVAPSDAADILGCTISLVLSGSQTPPTLSCAPDTTTRQRLRSRRQQRQRLRSRRQPRRLLRSRRQQRQRLRSRRQPRRLPRRGLVRAASRSTTRRTAGGSTGRTTRVRCSHHLDRSTHFVGQNDPSDTGGLTDEVGQDVWGPDLRTGER